MSAPRRRRVRNQEVAKTRNPAETRIAVVGSSLIVFGTLFLIWGMRPGNYNPGTGGILHRQPRVSWWIFLTVFFVGFVVWLVRRPDANFAKPRRTLVVLLSAVMVSSLVVFGIWQARGGILRHYQVPTTIPTPPSVPTKPSLSLPTVPSTTPASVPTTAPPSTAKP